MGLGKSARRPLTECGEAGDGLSNDQGVVLVRALMGSVVVISISLGLSVDEAIPRSRRPLSRTDEGAGRRRPGDSTEAPATQEQGFSAVLIRCPLRVGSSTVRGVDDLERSLDDVVQRTGFSGAVRVDDADGTRLAKAYGYADRANEIPNTVDTRFAAASAAKTFTALTVMNLVEHGRLTLQTTARSILGEDLPLIDDAATVEQLLAHRAGIGDYFDEDEEGEITDYVLTVPMHQLAATEDYLRVLDGFPQKFPPGERFTYCNGGYVVLALIAERVAGQPFPTLVQQAVSGPAGMIDTDYLRSDELPAGTALGYLFEKGARTNIHHLPVVGTGDGGIYTTVADMHAFWTALMAGRILPTERVKQMTEPLSTSPEDPRRYGLGFWLHPTSDVAMLEGYDAGVSFRSSHDPNTGLVVTVVSNWSDGAWPVSRHLNEVLGI